MSEFDFNDAAPAKETGGLIPEGTVALAVMVLRPGGHGPGGYYKKNRAGDKDMLDAEFTLASGKYERRKLWKDMIVAPVDTEAANITRSQLRAAIESAMGIHPADMSDEAIQRRRIPGYQFFDGLSVCLKVGIEKGKLKNPEMGPGSEKYEDKNVLRAFVTPDSADYISPGPAPQLGTFQTAGAAVASAARAAGGGTAKAAAAKPAWAS